MFKPVSSDRIFDVREGPDALLFRPRRRWRPPVWWVNIFLLIATFLTSTAFGSALVESFDRARPLDVETIVRSYVGFAGLNPAMWQGLWFSLPLLTILLSHELGHFIECRKRNVDASLPYFLPSPSLFGTFGAFIRIRSPIFSRAGLFDIGIAGPLAGFAMLLPFLVIGVGMSKIVRLQSSSDGLSFGMPLAIRLLERICFGSVPPSHIALHPMAMGAWAGLFATALNLLPIGQLDGGHIVYALGSELWHRRISLAFVALLGIAGFFYWAWWIWGVAMFFFGRRHPLVFDNTPLSSIRLLLCIGAVLMFLLSITLVPIRTA